MYSNINVSDMFQKEDNTLDKFLKYNQGKLDENNIKRAEEKIGHKLPKTYIEFLKMQNGGYLSEKYDDSWLTAIYGIGQDSKTIHSLEEFFDDFVNEWGCPNTLVPFGETQSGHDVYCMDYSSVDENKEPRIISIELESDDYKIYFVANDFGEFINMVNEHKLSLDNEYIGEIKNSFSEENTLKNSTKKDENDLNIDAIIVLCVAIFFLIFAIPLGKVAIIIDGFVIVICILLIIYSISKKEKEICYYCNLENDCCSGELYFAVDENNNMILECDDCELRYNSPEDVIKKSGYRVTRKKFITRPAKFEEIKSKGWENFILK